MADMKKKKRSYKYIGTAVVVVNETFNGDPKKRRGAKNDLDMMQKLFTMLNFKVKIYKDLETTEILEKLDKAKKWSESYSPKCFAFVISTHGGEFETDKVKQAKAAGSYAEVFQPAIWGTNMASLTIDDITSRFIENNSAFKGIPKLFFIQACRSRQGPSVKPEDAYDRGVNIYIKKMMGGNTGSEENKQEGDDAVDHGVVSEADSRSDSVEDLLKDFCFDDEKSDDEWTGDDTDTQVDDDADDDDTGAHGDEEDARGNAGTTNMPSVPGDPKPQEGEDEPDAKGDAGSGSMPFQVARFDCPEDCLIMQPVMPGKFAWRHKDHGSWMLHYMYTNKGMLLENTPLLPYLTKVCHDMAKHDIYPTDLSLKLNKPYRMCSTVTHRLSNNLIFEPEESTSFMAIVKRKLISLKKQLQSQK